MPELVRRIPGARAARETALPEIEREWIVTNGLGGYASGNVAGANTRRYHGLLIAALPAPVGRVVMLNQITERVRLPDGSQVHLDLHELSGSLPEPKAVATLTEFRLECGLPVWSYRIGEFEIEKRVVLPHGQNTVYVMYRLVSGGGSLRLKLQPAVHFRLHEAPVDEPLAEPYVLTVANERYELSASGNGSVLRMLVQGRRPTFTFERSKIEGAVYSAEAQRGYPSRGDLWSPGRFAVDLDAGVDAALVGSAEAWEAVAAMTAADVVHAEHERRTHLLAQAPAGAQSGIAAELVLAADQFIITPAGRVEDAARARAAGDEVRTVIAGYHWFTDWGRDTMIGLEGLTLCTGRHAEAGYILRTFAHYVRDGLIPNMFPEGERDGLYHTADATLWFFHAISRYLAYTNDRGTLAALIPTLVDIVEHHVQGTRFGIGVDANDGLLRQGAEGYQLTWMDAKVDDWVVTPRRGKAVEINALWYNALRLLEAWVRAEKHDADLATMLARHAERARHSFNERFWSGERGYLFDVVDGEHGDDDACRPNQILAIALEHPILDEAHWKDVVGVVADRLLTPVGLRSLAPGHPDYHARYDGDLRARDAAYHQGTVWAWLVGPFVDALRKTFPGDVDGARAAIDGFERHLGEAGIGTISEIFDAEPPYRPRGCIAQAWSVAEVLRCWLAIAARPAGAEPQAR